MSDIIQLRGGISSLWASTNPILAAREIGVETDTNLYKIGNGSSTWNLLSYTALSGEFQSLMLDVQASNPAAPAAGKMLLYAKSVSGRLMPKIIGPKGLDTALQPFLARNKVGYWCPPGNSTTLPGVFGYTAPVFTGTLTTRNITTANAFQRMRRIGLVGSSVAGSLVSSRVAAVQITVGDGAGNGGFHTITRFGISDAAFVTSARMFMGIGSSILQPTNVEPNTLLNSIGVGHGAADINLKMYCAGSAVQPSLIVDLGSGFPINTTSADPYELALFSASSDNSIVSWEVTNIGTGATASGVFNGTPGVQIPASSTLLTYLWSYRSNNATALAVGMDYMSDYIETDL
jgi:hypothetical protein